MCWRKYIQATRSGWFPEAWNRCRFRSLPTTMLDPKVIYPLILFIILIFQNSLHLHRSSAAWTNGAPLSTAWLSNQAIGFVNRFRRLTPLLSNKRQPHLAAHPPCGTRPKYLSYAGSLPLVVRTLLPATASFLHPELPRLSDVCNPCELSDARSVSTSDILRPRRLRRYFCLTVGSSRFSFNVRVIGHVDSSCGSNASK